jgi:DNA-binding response OmpR family regulator
MTAWNSANQPILQTKRLLVVEDEGEMRQLIRRKLTNAGFDVLAAASGAEGLALIAQHGLPHVAIVDINMPGMNGLEFCERVQQFADLPVIMVTAVSESVTTVAAIERYAEDYIVKPFNLDELVARIHRLLRRINDFSYAGGPWIAVNDRLTVNFSRQSALVDGVNVELTPIETKLLHIFSRYIDRVLTSEFLLGRIWPGQEIFEDTLRVHVHRLRQKIEGSAAHEKYILTERGIGYRFISSGKEGT